MKSMTRNWRLVIGGVAAGSAALIGIAGTNASAEPIAPAPVVPAPVTVTQTVTVAPQAGAVAAAPEATPAVAPAPAATAAAAPALPAITPATSGTLKEFFKEKGVTMEPQKAAGFTALNIVLPVPTGWSLVPDPNVPDAFTVIADRKGGDALYTPNAQLTVYKLVGEFDPREAISHGFLDSQLLPSWQPTSASLDPFGGFQSSQIAGTYRDTDLTLNTTRRHVIAQSGSDRYLVTLSVTTAANQVVAASAATEGIVTGFKVNVPGATPAPAVAAAPVNPLSATVPLTV
ncbi:MAG: LpqN/LpqT family lipoprotein, partial [Mycobacterium sp.]